MNTLKLIVFTCGLIITCKSAQADLIASESFAYPFGQPLTQTTGTGTGFSNNWTVGGRNTIFGPLRIQNNSLNFAGVASSGNSVVSTALTSDISGVFRQTTQAFAGVSNGQTTFLSILMRQDSLGGQLGGFGGIYVGNSTSEFDPKLFIGKGGASNNWLLESLGGGGAAQSNVAVSVGQTALLVVKMETLAGNDRFTLFVNPTGSTEPLTGFVKNDLNLGTANRVTIYNTGAFSFDEIRIGTTFADVIIAVPEPSSGVLLVMAIGVCSLRHRRK